MNRTRAQTPTSQPDSLRVSEQDVGPLRALTFDLWAEQFPFSSKIVGGCFGFLGLP